MPAVSQVNLITNVYEQHIGVNKKNQTMAKVNVN